MDDRHFGYKQKTPKKKHLNWWAMGASHERSSCVLTDCQSQPDEGARESSREVWGSEVKWSNRSCVWVRDNNNLIQEWSQVPMLVVFPGDEDDMMFMTKRTPNSQVITKRRKHPNLYSTDNTGPRKTRTHSLIDTREMGESARERDLHQKAVAPISRQPTSRALSGLGVSSKPRPRSVRNKTVPFHRVPEPAPDFRATTKWH
jgi:hypothetical protein